MSPARISGIYAGEVQIKDLVEWCTPKNLVDKNTIIGLIQPDGDMQFCLVHEPKAKNYKPADGLLDLVKAAKSSLACTFFFKHTVTDGMTLNRISNATHSTDKRSSEAFVKALISHYIARVNTPAPKPEPPIGSVPFDPFEL